MNMIITNIGHYRITDYKHSAYSMFNQETDRVISLSKEQYDAIMSDMSVGMCELVELSHLMDRCNV